MPSQSIQTPFITGLSNSYRLPSSRFQSMAPLCRTSQRFFSEILKFNRFEDILLRHDGGFLTGMSKRSFLRLVKVFQKLSYFS